MTGSVRYTRHETNSCRKYSKIDGVSLISDRRVSKHASARGYGTVRSSRNSTGLVRTCMQSVNPLKPIAHAHILLNCPQEFNYFTCMAMHADYSLVVKDRARQRLNSRKN